MRDWLFLHCLICLLASLLENFRHKQVQDQVEGGCCQCQVTLFGTQQGQTFRTAPTKWQTPAVGGMLFSALAGLNIYFPSTSRTLSAPKNGVSGAAPPQEASRQTSQAQWAQWEILSNAQKWSVGRKKRGRDSVIVMSRLQWIFMQLSVGAARSAGTNLRWLLFEFPHLCQSGIIAQLSGRSDLIQPFVPSNIAALLQISFKSRQKCHVVKIWKT